MRNFILFGIFFMLGYAIFSLYIRHEALLNKISELERANHYYRSEAQMRLDSIVLLSDSLNKTLDSLDLCKSYFQEDEIWQDSY